MSTPARQQFLDIKRQHPDALLLYQMGDFYELFDEDARIAARDLQITLTSREFGRSGRVPMAGVPVAALSSYLRRLLAKGHRVAICDQMSTGQQNGPGLIERAVRCVVTAGTAIDPALIAPAENGYLVALAEGKDGLGLAALEASTGEFVVTQFRADEEAELQAELTRLQPRECLVPETESGRGLARGQAESLRATFGTAITLRDGWRFAAEGAARRLRDQFGVASTEAFGCADWPLALGAAGAVVDYLAETNRHLLSGLRPLQSYSTGSFVRLDHFTRRNLEIFRSARTGDQRQSLVAVVDRTKTATGARLLRRWLGQPLTDLTELTWRQDAVAALVDNPDERRAIRAAFSRVNDLERTVARLRQGLVTPREVAGIPETLDAVPPVLDALAGLTAGPLRALRHDLDPCTDLAGQIRRALGDGPAELIRSGFSAELDDIRQAAVDARGWIARLEQTERARTGIRTLKVGFNRVFGYYLEITRPNLGLVPADYRRTQTLANAERFITAELKQHETIVVNAQDRVATLEARLFDDLVRTLAASGARLRALADAVAHLDVYAALAELAANEGYTRPELHDGPEIAIEGGRHPVVEACLPAGDFVPNNLQIGPGVGRILLITGPNMAGKSTYLRQVALICLLGQIGSFVPATTARLGLVDRIFTRIGAQDDLAAGASTFLVEMVETANILRHATGRSLVILDEIGRGTSTWDGLAIARAVLEHLHDATEIRCLFATHYHELVALTDTCAELRPYHLSAIEAAGDIVFLRRLQPGGAEKSYGIQVARLAGLPAGVLERAHAILAEFERAPGVPLPNAVSRGAETEPPVYRAEPAPERPTNEAAPVEGLARDVLSIDVLNSTPLEVLGRLAALQATLRERLWPAPVRTGGEGPDAPETGVLRFPALDGVVRRDGSHA